MKLNTICIKLQKNKNLQTKLLFLLPGFLVNKDSQNLKFGLMRFLKFFLKNLKIIGSSKQFSNQMNFGHCVNEVA